MRMKGAFICAAGGQGGGQELTQQGLGCRGDLSISSKCNGSHWRVVGRLSRRVQIPVLPTFARSTAQTTHPDVLSKSGRRESRHTVQFRSHEEQRRTKPASTVRCQVDGCQ